MKNKEKENHKLKLQVRQQMKFTKWGPLRSSGNELGEPMRALYTNENIYPDHISYPFMDEMMKYHRKANAHFASRSQC